MPWKRMLAYITGSVNEDLLRRIEYLLEENRVLRNQIQKRILLTDHERRTLADKAIVLGKLMADTVTIVQPGTILKWYRRLVAKKFDGSRFRKRQGRPLTKTEIEDLVVRLACENPAWGYDRIVGAVHNLGYDISDQTIGNILQRNGLGTSPERRKNTTWASFIRQHREVLWATDFFTTEIWTRWGLTTVCRQPNLDTVELVVKVWSQGLGGSGTPEGVPEKIATAVAASRIDGFRNWASICPQETDEYATSESTEPTRRRE